MAQELLASKTIVQEEEPRVRAIPAIPTAVPGVVGLTERGPIGSQQLITSWDEFLDVFGGFIADSDLVPSVELYFRNGGSRLHVVRTAHYTDPTNPATQTALKGDVNLMTEAGQSTFGTVTSSGVAPFALASGDHLDIDVDLAASPTVVTFTGTAAVVESGSAQNYDMSGDPVLNVKIDGEATAQAIAFVSATDFGTPTAATADEVADAINARLDGGKAYTSSGGTKVTIESDLKGTDSHVEVTGGSANTPLAFPTAEQDGGGNVADIKSVTGAEVKTIVEFAVAGVTVTGSTNVSIRTDTIGSGGAIQVDAASTADTKMGFDNAVHAGSDAAAAPTIRADAKDFGAYSLRVEVRTSAPSNGLGGDWFNAQTLLDGVVFESFPNLTMDDTDPRYFETIVNDATDGSRLVQLVDLALGVRPAFDTWGPLAGGSDGGSLVDADFSGDEGGQTGLYALDTVQDLSILAVPGRATAGVATEMVSYCEVHRNGQVFPVFDVPEDSTAEEARTYFETTASLVGATEFGAGYWPWCKIVNPSERAYGAVDEVIVPPSGAVIGIMARNDGGAPSGVYQSPAGIEYGVINGIIGFEHDESLREAKRDIVYPSRINPLTTYPGAPFFVDGGRTFKATGNFPNIAERRGVIFIEQSIKRGIDFARHLNNTAALRARVNRTITAFLVGEMNRGAFRTKDPATAFFVNTSDKINPPSEVFAGRLNVRIGLATNKPAEFIILKFSQDTRALEEQIAAGQ